jgi:hypothetical protein
MTEEDFDYKKPSFVLFIIILAIIVVVLLMDWVFTFFKERM